MKEHKMKTVGSGISELPPAEQGRALTDRPRKAHSARLRLLVALNLAVFAVLAGFLVWEYLGNRTALFGKGGTTPPVADLILPFIVLGLALTAVLYGVTARLTMRPLKVLAAAARRIADGELGAQVESPMPTELAIVASEFNSMSARLAQADMRRRAEMEKARQIQRHLLPAQRAFADPPLAWRYEPATEVAGDYVDVRAVGDALLVVVADVAGHGVPAAMGAAMLKTLFSGAVSQTSNPSVILAEINRGFAAVTPDEDFASMIVLSYDQNGNTLRHASAGHEPAYLMRGGAVAQTLSATGPLLGISEEGQWLAEDVAVAPGDLLIIVTDGLVETRAPDGRQFGRERLSAILGDGETEPLDDLLSRLLASASTLRGNADQEDDITLVAMRFCRR